MMNQYEIDYQQGYDNANDEWLERIDKIRAEIMKLQLYKMFMGEDTFYIERDDVLEIIDKYRKEDKE